MDKKEAIKIAKEIIKQGGVGAKKIGLSNSKEDPLIRNKKKINRFLKKIYYSS